MKINQKCLELMLLDAEKRGDASASTSLRERIAAQTIKGTNGYEMRYVCQSSMVISYSYFLSETFPSMTTTTSP
jgi:hypothetical protein